MEKTKNNLIREKIESLIRIIANNPFQRHPPYEKLLGGNNRYSRRINHQHRLVYEVQKDKHIIKVLSMWTHYQ